MFNRNELVDALVGLLQFQLKSNKPLRYLHTHDLSGYAVLNLHVPFRFCLFLLLLLDFFGNALEGLSCKLRCKYTNQYRHAKGDQENDILQTAGLVDASINNAMLNTPRYESNRYGFNEPRNMPPAKSKKGTLVTP